MQFEYFLSGNIYKEVFSVNRNKNRLKYTVNM